jgi:hypothetical protein
MSFEIVFFAGAFVLLAALIYGILSNRYRDRAAVRAAEDITRARYRHDDPYEKNPHADHAPRSDVPRKVREPVGIEPDFSEEDIQRAQLGPRGVPGAADPARMTPQRKKKTPTHIDQGHVS